MELPQWTIFNLMGCTWLSFQNTVPAVDIHTFFPREEGALHVRLLGQPNVCKAKPREHFFFFGELSFIGGEIRTYARETASQVAPRNCSPMNAFWLNESIPWSALETYRGESLKVPGLENSCVEPFSPLLGLCRFFSTFDDLSQKEYS